jgi:hypothetical protein
MHSGVISGTGARMTLSRTEPSTMEVSPSAIAMCVATSFAKDLEPAAPVGSELPALQRPPHFHDGIGVPYRAAGYVFGPADPGETRRADPHDERHEGDGSVTS